MTRGREAGSGAMDDLPIRAIETILADLWQQMHHEHRLMKKSQCAHEYSYYWAMRVRVTTQTRGA